MLLRSLSHPDIIAVSDAASRQRATVLRMGCATGLAMAASSARLIALLRDDARRRSGHLFWQPQPAPPGWPVRRSATCRAMLSGPAHAAVRWKNLPAARPGVGLRAAETINHAAAAHAAATSARPAPICVTHRRRIVIFSFVESA